MELRREDLTNGPVVTGFSGQGFRVGERLFEHGLWLTADDARDWNAPARVDLLSADMLADLLQLTPVPEFLLLGTGANLVRPGRLFVEALEAQGIGVEAMDSRAAARAWGVLRQEDRQIVAALLPLG